MVVQQRVTWSMVLVAVVTLLVIAVLVITAPQKDHFQFSMSDYALANTNYASTNLNVQPNPDKAPTEDCWIYYVPPKYQQACRLGYFDKTSLVLQTRVNELERKTNLNRNERDELEQSKLTLEARATVSNLPNNGYGCRLGFADGKTQVKMDMSDPQTIASRNDENGRGQLTTNTSNWAYCWIKSNSMDEARQRINAIGSTESVVATPDMLATFSDSSDQFLRVNFQRLDYESVKRSTCSTKMRTSPLTDTVVLVGFDLALQNNANKIVGYNVYVAERNQLKTLANYNPRADPVDVYMSLFTYKTVKDDVYITPVSGLNISTVKVDPVCGIITETPLRELRTLNLASHFGVKDVFVANNTESLDLSRGPEGLDEQYNVVAAEYLSLQGKLPKKAGVEMRQYKLSRSVWNYLDKAYSTSGLDYVFKNLTSNMKVTYPRSPYFWNTTEYQAWEVLCFMYIESDGTYEFKMSSDDAGEMWVDEKLVSTHYGYHGTDWGASQGKVKIDKVDLTRGFVKVFVRLFQVGGGQGLYLYWRPPGEKEWAKIPEGVFFYEDNTIVRKMNAINDVRDALTRSTYTNVKNMMNTITGATFAPNSTVSSFVSAYDRIYVYMGSPSTVLKPSVSPQTQQVLQHGPLDVSRFQRNAISPASVDLSAPVQYTISLWLRVERACTSWRNVFTYGTSNGDRTPALFIVTWRGDLLLHIRHRANTNSTQRDNEWNYGINVNMGGKNYAKWMHVAFTVDNNIMTVYVNGVKRADSDKDADMPGTDKTNMRANGWTFSWGDRSKAKTFGFSTVSNTTTPATQIDGPYYIQKLYWYNTALSSTEVQRLAAEPIALSSATTYVSPSTPKTLAELFSMTTKSGEATLMIENMVYRVYVQVLTDNGVTSKWVLILNYLHKGGTNPTLFVRGANDDFPVLKSTNLGDDGSLDRPAWGHLGCSMLKRVNDVCGPIGRLRFYGRGGNATHSWQNRTAPQSYTRTIHFTTADPSILSYAMTGVGSFPVPFQFTAMSDHNASIPANSPSRFFNQGDYALTEFPFWRGGEGHWGIRGGISYNIPERWEIDDAPDAALYHTYHQVWIGL